MRIQITTALLALALAGCAATPATPPTPTPAPPKPTTPPISTPAATAPPGGTPVTNPVVSTAVADMARQRGVDPVAIKVERVEERDWPDAGLGCPEPGRSYAAVITPGYLIVLSHGGTTINYHADRDGRVVRPCTQP